MQINVITGRSEEEKNQLRYRRGYFDTLGLVERLHRLLLDILKDEFEKSGNFELNAVQSLLVYNIGDNELTAGELRAKGYYQGSNVSYNLKKLVELGYIHHERCLIDRRSVRIKLTPKGHEIRDRVKSLFEGHIEKIKSVSLFSVDEMAAQGDMLRRLERFWTDQIRYIY